VLPIHIGFSADCIVFHIARYEKGLKPYDCRGCARSEFTARRCVDLLKPKLNTLEEDSWEELEAVDIGGGAESLRWLVWVSMQVLSSPLIHN
jgi:hypothetical protein